MRTQAFSHQGPDQGYLRYIAKLADFLVPRIISIASGKGGVGKTSFSINLAFSLAENQQKTCLIDADLGLANIDTVLGVKPNKTLEQVIFQDLALESALVNIIPCLDLLPGGSGIPALANLSPEQHQSLLLSISKLKYYDYILIDNSPGLTPAIISFCLSSKEIVVLLTPEPASLVDGYALIKSLKENGLQYPPFLVLNRVKSKNQAQKILAKINSACKKKLHLPLLFLGTIPEHWGFALEQEKNQAICTLFPESSPAKCFSLIARRLANRPRKELFELPLEHFWDQAIRQYKHRNFNPSSWNHSSSLAAAQDQVETGLDRLIKSLEERPQGQRADLNDYLNRLNTKFQELLSKLRGPIESEITKNKENLDKVAIVSKDPSMRLLLTDMLKEFEYIPYPLQEKEDIRPKTAFCLISLDSSNQEQLDLNSFNLEGRPAIAIAGRGRDTSLNILRQKTELLDIITSPFSLSDFKRSLSKVKEHAKTTP